jgi:ABC-type transport system substrate-binding protein
MLRASLVLLALTLAGCGAAAEGSTTSSTNQTTSSPTAAGVITMLMRTWPALDPATDPSTPSRPVRDEDVDWFVYTGLTAYSHTVGRKTLIPGLAQSMPVTTGGGKTYVATLRARLVFSDGKPVTAGDFLYTVERDLRIRDGSAAAQIAKLIIGARAFELGRSRTVEGITTDNATRTIVIRLTAPDRSFDRLLATPALGLIPAGTPMRPSTVVPPPGAGPYELTNVVPKTSFSVVKNPEWASHAVPGIPPAQLNINVKVDSGPAASTLAVLSNEDDVFDWSVHVPAALNANVESGAPHRYARRGRVTEFTSTRIDFGALRFSRRYGLDLTSLSLAAG